MIVLHVILNYDLRRFGSSEIIIFFIIGVAIAVGLFFLFRLITCWYLKINKRVDLLEQQVRLLTEMNMKIDKLASDKQQTL